MLYGWEDDDDIIMSYKEIKIPNIKNPIFRFLRQIDHVGNMSYECCMDVVWIGG